MNLNNGEDKYSYDDRIKFIRDTAPYVGLGIQLAATITVMFFAGHWLDNYFETSPVLTITFAFLGGFAAIYNFVKTVLELDKKRKSEENT